MLARYQLAHQAFRHTSGYRPFVCSNRLLTTPEMVVHCHLPKQSSDESHGHARPRRPFEIISSMRTRLKNSQKKGRRPHLNRPHIVGRMSNMRCNRLQAREAAPSLLLDVFERPGITVRQGRLFRQVREHRHRTPIFPQGCAAWLQRQQAHHGLQKYVSDTS